MDVVGVKTFCGDGGCKMVWGSMVLISGFWYGIMYKILGITIIDECNAYVSPEFRGKYERTMTAVGGKTILWHQRMGYQKEIKSCGIITT